MEAANILKPALARGSIRLIGATTTAECRRDIERDPALERRFQAVYVGVRVVEVVLAQIVVRDVTRSAQCRQRAKAAVAARACAQRAKICTWL